MSAQNVVRLMYFRASTNGCALFGANLRFLEGTFGQQLRRKEPKRGPQSQSGSLSFHFLSLGNSCVMTKSQPTQKEDSIYPRKFHPHACVSIVIVGAMKFRRVPIV